MSAILEWWSHIYNRYDPRTDNWFLVSGLGPTFSIIAFYLYFCTILGPRLMRDRKPYTLRKTLIVYNFTQVLLSIYLVYEGLMTGWLFDYNYRCQPVDYSNSPKALRMARAVYAYYICKLIELLDTVFFVMRKKQRQISFLHLYHHSIMPFCAWIGVRYVPGGHATLLGLINAFIHIFMYLYYMLSAFGPQMQKYLWWKKHLTLLQIIQFSIILAHNAQVLFTDCNYPKPLAVLLCINASFFIYLFGSFYFKNYSRDINSKKKQEVADSKKDRDISNGNAETNGCINGVTNGHAKVDSKID